jgi:uncharacterized Zn finger protein
MSRFGWKPYVPVHKRRAAAQRKMKQLAKQGHAIEPVAISGRKIALTFWGEAWCNHLEQFSDYENRLPRGRTYARNGSVCHLAIRQGTIEAIVSGSELYDITIAIKPLAAGKWKRVREQCTGRIGSMLELLQGKFSRQVMEIVTHRDHGLFPSPGEIEMRCSCPDWAGLCKHLAAVLYGIGARLDQQPELLFKLRGVDHQELITADLDLTTTGAGSGKRRRLDDDDLSGLFGVEIDADPEPVRRSPVAAKKATATKAGAEKGGAKKATTKRVLAKRVGAKTVSPVVSATVRKQFTPTAEAVAELRHRLGMNKSQFATLIGVSPPTIGNWEKREGLLTPQPEVLDALRELAAGATKGARRK